MSSLLIPNLRDVGETVNLIVGDEILKEGYLFRGGTVNNIFGVHELPPVRSIINLRRGKDQEFDGINNIQIPSKDHLENYETSNKLIKKWIKRILRVMTDSLEWPILVHCSAGKDRTGVITACILKALDIPESVIIEEYLQSEGVINSKNIIIALKGMRDIKSYLSDKNIINLLQKQLKA